MPDVQVSDEEVMRIIKEEQERKVREATTAKLKPKMPPTGAGDVSRPHGSADQFVLSQRKQHVSH
jgi:hypothetical protein